jgi:hypothetical protein
MLRLALRFSAPHVAVALSPTSSLLCAVVVARTVPDAAPQSVVVAARRLLGVTAGWQRCLLSLAADGVLLSGRGKRRGRRMLLWRSTVFSLRVDRLSYTDADETEVRFEIVVCVSVCV